MCFNKHVAQASTNHKKGCFNMNKIIAKEVPPCSRDFSIYFDGDCFKASCGDEKYAIYIIGNPRYTGNFNFDNISLSKIKRLTFLRDLTILSTSMNMPTKAIRLVWRIMA